MRRIGSAVSRYPAGTTATEQGEPCSSRSPVLPGSTGERLLHGSPCSVAVVPVGYRDAVHPIRRIGVAYNHTDEARAAVRGAAVLAEAFGAELELIGVVSAESFSTPALMGGGPSIAHLREDVEQHVQETLDTAVAAVSATVPATSVRLLGSPADELTARSHELDLLVIGSRGYGPLHSSLVGGVSGRVMRSAQCPVIVVPRGLAAPLGGLFDSTAATVA